MKIVFFLYFFFVVLQVQTTPPVVIDMYMEAMCPGSMDFIKSVITPFIKKKGWETLAEINFIAYGTTKEQSGPPDYQFKCHHGKKECIGNLIINCATRMYDNKKAVTFVVCLQNAFKKDFRKAMAKCSESEQMLEELTSCLDDNRSKDWLHEAGVKTFSLNPPIEWVPWITINGKENSKIYDADDLAYFLCKRIKYSDVYIPLCSKS